jgi:WD40 repeat protein
VGHPQVVTALSFSPDGRRIASAGGKDTTAKIWNAETGAVLHTLGHTSYTKHARFSSDGRNVLTTSWDQTLKIWRADTGALLATSIFTKTMNG